MNTDGTPDRDGRLVGDDSDADAILEWNQAPRELTDEEKAALARLYPGAAGVVPPATPTPEAAAPPDPGPTTADILEAVNRLAGRPIEVVLPPPAATIEEHEITNPDGTVTRVVTHKRPEAPGG
jgi:hypothetical protein